MASAQPSKSARVTGKITDTVQIGSLLAANQIKDVALTRHASSAVISFTTAQETIPTVDIGTAAPIINKDGDWTFRPHDAVRGYNAGLGPKTLQHAINLYGLEPATTYHYIISARSDKPDAPLAQETGSFTTISQRVKVTLESIKLLTASDDDGTDELNFRLWANAEWTSARFVDVPPFLMSSAGEKTFKKTMIVENAPDVLILQADGYDDDTHAFNSEFNPFNNRPLPRAGSSSAGNWNVASAVFDLSRYPSPPGKTTADGGFELITIRGEGAHQLQFRVRGSFQVIRPRTIDLSTVVKDHVDISDATKAKLKVQPGRSDSTTIKRRSTTHINPDN